MLEEQHVTRAAQRLGLSQPAVSRSLARLRRVLDDALLVRAGQRLVPTPRGASLVGPVRQLLADAGRIFDVERGFDPATSRRHFVIIAGEYSQLALGPQLVGVVRAEAPNVRIYFRSAMRPGAIASLEDGSADLAFAPPIDELAAGFHRRLLLQDDYVCLVRASRHGAWDLERYLETPHVVVAPRGEMATAVDVALARRGLERRVVASTPLFAVAPLLVAGGDLVATIQRRIATALLPTGSPALRLVPPPPELGLGMFALHAMWHDRAHRDGGVRWLRDAARRAAAE